MTVQRINPSDFLPFTGGYGTTSWDNSSGNYHILSPDSGTSQAEWSIEKDGRMYSRVRTRSSASDAWGAWGAWEEQFQLNADGSARFPKNVFIKQSSIDRNGANPSSDQWFYSNGYIDKDDDVLIQFTGVRRTSGRVTAGIYAYNASNTNNGLTASIDPDGTASYGITSPGAFRKAIGVDALLKIQAVNATIPANSSNVSVTAPTVSGYTFQCWVECISVGWVASVTAANPANATSSMWTTASSSSARSIRCFALYTLN